MSLPWTSLTTWTRTRRAYAGLQDRADDEEHGEDRQREDGHPAEDHRCLGARAARLDQRGERTAVVGEQGAATGRADQHVVARALPARDAAPARRGGRRGGLGAADPERVGEVDGGRRV